MRDLIYISSKLLGAYDPILKSKTYVHNKWFNLSNSTRWPWHTNSRVGQLDTPWHLHSTLSPIPRINESETRFDVVLDSIADEFGKSVELSDKTVYLYWSGGVDSTSILVSILRTWSPTLLKRLVILYDTVSLHENAYFYHTFIKGRLSEQSVASFEVNKDNYNKIIILDGEGGNQCTVGLYVQNLAYLGRFDLLTEPWRNQKDLKKLLLGAEDFNVELVTDSIKHAPVDIVSGYEFLWWATYNFKYDDVMIRKMFGYSKALTSQQTKVLWDDGIYRFYRHPRMQVWAMNNCRQREEKLHITVKYVQKDYIYQFDKNDFYWSSKIEQGSNSPKLQETYPNAGIFKSPLFAIDKDWKKYSLADPETRKELGRILERV
jgi:hypothetical protein